MNYYRPKHYYSRLLKSSSRSIKNYPYYTLILIKTKNLAKRMNFIEQKYLKQEKDL